MAKTSLLDKGSTLTPFCKIAFKRAQPCTANNIEVPVQQTRRTRTQRLSKAFLILVSILLPPSLPPPLPFLLPFTHPPVKLPYKYLLSHVTPPHATNIAATSRHPGQKWRSALPSQHKIDTRDSAWIKWSLLLHLPPPWLVRQRPKHLHPLHLPQKTMKVHSSAFYPRI